MSGPIKKSRKRPVILVLFLLVLIPARVEGDTNRVKIIPVQDPLYGTIDMLHAELRLAPPSGSRPWSIEEWHRILDRLDVQTSGRRLSPAARTALDHIRNRLREEQEYNLLQGETYQVDLSLALALEAYGHVNRDDFPDEEDWFYGYTRRSPLLLVALEMDLHDWLYIYGDVEYRKNRYAYEEKTDSPSTEKLYNHPFSTNVHSLQYVDFEMPYRAFVAAGGDRWNLVLGRDLMRWGHGRTGNFVINDHLDYHDKLRFVSFHDRLKVEATYLFLDHPGWLEPDPERDDGDLLGRRERPAPGVRLFMAHRLEFRPLEWLSLALTENVMYQHDTVEPGVLNPAYIFHNLNNRSMFNAIASAEVEAAVLPGFTLLYQFSLYQARAPLEGDSQPDAMGHLAGYRLVLPRGRGYLYHDMEGVYSDTYMYQRDLVDMKVLRRQFVIDYRFAMHQEFLGYPRGGDVVVVNGVLGYHRPEAFNVHLDVTHTQRGEIGINTVIESPADFESGRQAPSGRVERTWRAGLEGRWYGRTTGRRPWDRGISFFTRLDAFRVVNKGNEKGSPVWDLQYALGAAWTLR